MITNGSVGSSAKPFRIFRFIDWVAHVASTESLSLKTFALRRLYYCLPHHCNHWRIAIIAFNSFVLVRCLFPSSIITDSIKTPIRVLQSPPQFVLLCFVVCCGVYYSLLHHGNPFRRVTMERLILSCIQLLDWRRQLKNKSLESNSTKSFFAVT